MKISSKILFKIFGILLIFFTQQSFADDFVSTNDVVKEIEKSLVYDKSARQQIDFYKKTPLRKSQINIKAGETADNKSSKSSDQMSIVVSNPKLGSASIREKEQFAYNSVLVGQYEVAIELYKQILQSEPNNNYAKFALGTVYQKIGQFRQAKVIYYQMLKSGAENQDEIIGNLLDILIEDSPQDATYLLSRLAIQNPDSANILAYASISYSKVKNYDQAISMMQKAIALDGKNIDYKYNLAVMYDNTKQYAKAADLYSQVVRECPDDNQSVPVDQIKKRVEFITDLI